MSALGLPEAQETSEPRVGVLRVLTGLLVVAVAVSAVWIVIAWGISTFGRSGLSLEEVEAYSLVDLPDDARVLTATLESDASHSTFYAEVELPVGGPAPLEGSAYLPLVGAAPAWAAALPDRLDGVVLYAAEISGADNELGAATGTNEDGRDILVLYSRLAD